MWTVIGTLVVIGTTALMASLVISVVRPYPRPALPPFHRHWWGPWSKPTVVSCMKPTGSFGDARSASRTIQSRTCVNEACGKVDIRVIYEGFVP